MREKDWTVPAIVTETLTVLALVSGCGLRIFYGIYYQVAPASCMVDILVAVLFYAGALLLQLYPEYLNHLTREQCRDGIRRDSLWMVRLVKLVFMVSLLVTCICDVLGQSLPGIYNAVVILLLFAIVLLFESRIIGEIRSGGKDGRE